MRKQRKKLFQMHTVEGKSPKEIIRWLRDNKHLGFNELTATQINNITQRLNVIENGPAKMTINELSDRCQQKANAPEKLDKMFTVSVLNVSNDIAFDLYCKVFITIKRL